MYLPVPSVPMYCYPTDDFGNCISYDSVGEIEILFISLSAYGLNAKLPMLGYNVQVIV
jgi:hypothetical protein